MGMLEVRNLTLTLGGSKILNNLSLDFWEGHIHAVVGPNGAGKSTLAATIMGLSGYRDFEGEILFDGQSIKELTLDQRAKRGITLAWQEPARYEGLTVRDFIKASAKDKSEEAIRSVLSGVGLRDGAYIERAVDRTLSGGERKKVELASILAMEPRLVFLDEPDSGIDVESLQRIFDAVQTLKAAGSTVILITHSPTVLKQAEHAFLICCGELIDKGSVDKIDGYFRDRCVPCDHKNRPDSKGGGDA
jgi:Fe-S cluster assembly ATP-binding protein